MKIVFVFFALLGAFVFDKSRFFNYNNNKFAWRDARVAEWGDLEHHYTRKGIGGSNPPPAAF